VGCVFDNPAHWQLAIDAPVVTLRDV